MLKIISSTARRMQRLGFLKYVVASASLQRPSSAATIGRALLSAVSHKHAAVISSETREYCDRVFSEQHYRALRSQVQEAAEQQTPSQVDLELQDIYLSQDVLPSKRGRILSGTEKDIHVFPTLAVNLEFLTPKTYVLTSRGRLFANTVSPGEIDAFNRPLGINPLIISSGQAMVLLFSFLEADGDLASMLYPAIARKDGEFADYEVGDLIGELLSGYLLRVEKSATRMKDKTKISKLKRTAESIKRWENKPYTGKGSRDEWATLRLEPFVDMGLLTKPDKFAYKYAFNNRGRRFISHLESSSDLDSFLTGGYVSAAAQLLDLQASPSIDSTEALDFLKNSNRLLANNIGYSDVIDTALLSAINLLHQRNKVLEIGESIQILKEAQKKTPRDIHFNIDRWGNLKFINFRKL
jgi:hypothetical protein